MLSSGTLLGPGSGAELDAEMEGAVCSHTQGSWNCIHVSAARELVVTKGHLWELAVPHVDNCELSFAAGGSS